LVAILAQAKFVEEPQDKQTYLVTREKLGVSRAVDHIDNPTTNNPDDPRAIDPDFEAPPTAEYVAIDPVTSMKRYIAASRDYMCEELKKAVIAGHNAEGHRHFGAALHVLEDFFAHSNFVELSLRKLGGNKVLPWTSPVQCRHEYPLVTGTFGGEDLVASIAGVLANALFKPELQYESRKPGERTMAEKIMLVILDEHSDPRPYQGFKLWLETRDKLESLPGAKWVLGTAFYATWPWRLVDFFVNCLLHLVGDSIDDAQVYAKGDPNTNGTTDPTHSQVSKDHDKHPFHVIAADLAKAAIVEVCRAMMARWKGDKTSDPCAKATAFLAHPYDTGWQDAKVKFWKANHPAEVARGESATEMEALRKAHEDELRDMVKQIRSGSKKVRDYVKKYPEVFSSEPLQEKR